MKKFNSDHSCSVNESEKQLQTSQNVYQQEEQSQTQASETKPQENYYQEHYPQNAPRNYPNGNFSTDNQQEEEEHSVLQNQEQQMQAEKENIYSARDLRIERKQMYEDVQGLIHYEIRKATGKCSELLRRLELKCEHFLSMSYDDFEECSANYESVRDYGCVQSLQKQVEVVQKRLQNLHRSHPSHINNVNDETFPIQTFPERYMSLEPSENSNTVHEPTDMEMEAVEAEEEVDSDYSPKLPCTRDLTSLQYKVFNSVAAMARKRTFDTVHDFRAFLIDKIMNPSMKNTALSRLTVNDRRKIIGHFKKYKPRTESIKNLQS